MEFGDEAKKINKRERERVRKRECNYANDSHDESSAKTYYKGEGENHNNKITKFSLHFDIERVCMGNVVLHVPFLSHPKCQNISQYT